MTPPIDIHTIPILSVCQPYAHLIVHGPKRIENRTWATKYRGWIGIHASKGRKYLPDADRLYDGMYGQGRMGPRPEFVFGAVIGAAKLVDCVSATHSQSAYARLMGDPWFEGPVGWVLVEARPIEPIPCRGMTGLFRLTKGNGG